MPNRQPLIIQGPQPLWKPPRGTRVDMEHPLARALVQAYLFNEGAGDPISAVNPAHRITRGTGVSWVVGKYGPALHFNNTTAGRAVLTKGFTPAATAFTVELAVRVTVAVASNNFEYLLGSQSAAGNGVMVSNGTLVTGWDLDTTTNDLQVGGLPTLNTWYHLHYVYVSSSSATIYENGINVVSGALAGAFTFPLGWMGADGTNASNNFGGDIGWLRIWDRALSATEVMQLNRAPWDMMVSPQERLWSIAIMGGATTGVTTSTRTVPTSLVALATSTRTVPTSLVVQATSTRTVPTSLVVQSTSTRTVPTSLVALQTATRTVPTSLVALATLTRTVPTSLVVTATLTRTVPTSLVVWTPNLVRTVPTSLVALATLTRTVPTSLVVLATLTRTVPTSLVVVGGANIRTVPTSLVALATLTRTVTSSLVVQQVNITRTVPTSLAVYATKIRTVPTSLVSLQTSTRTVTTSLVGKATLTRTVVTSLVALLTNITRTVPTSLVVIPFGFTQPGSVGGTDYRTNSVNGTNYRKASVGSLDKHTGTVGGKDS